MGGGWEMCVCVCAHARTHLLHHYVKQIYSLLWIVLKRIELTAKQNK